MILLLCATIVIVVLAVIAIIRSDKPVKLILAEAKYELIFQSLGSRNLLNDWMMRGQNKTGLTLKTALSAQFHTFLLQTCPSRRGKWPW